MAYIQKVLPPPNKILTFSMGDFSGGLNNRSFDIIDNQASDILNMKFSDEVTMEKRPNQEYVDEFNPGAPVTHMDEYIPYTETPKSIRATNTNVYVDGVLLTAVNGKINGTNYMGRYFFTDGNKMFVYGKFAQATTTYEKVIGTAVNDYVLLEIVDPPAGFVPLDNTHNQGVRNIDYTNKKVWYEPCDNEIRDTSLGSNVTPKKPQFMVSHKDRLFVSGVTTDDDNVFITNVANPFYFPVYLPMQPPPNSDKVVGLVVYDDAVIVGRNHDIFYIDGMTNNPNLGFPLFQLKRINSHTGFANQDSVKVAHNFLFFLGSDGNAYGLASARNDIKILQTTILSQTVDLFKYPINLTRSDVYTATSAFHDDEWYVSIKDKVLVYNYRKRAWTMYTGFDARSFYVKDGLLTWGNVSGRVCKFGAEYMDFGSVPYQAFFRSKFFDMDDSNSHKQFREFFIVAHTFDEFKSDVFMTFEIDYVDVNSDVVIANQISVWGKSRWGDRFITRNINASIPFQIGRRGRQIRFTMNNGYTPSEPVATRDDLNVYPERKENMLVLVQDEGVYYAFKGGVWEAKSTEDLNQPMRVYQVNGDYEFRGKR